MNFWRLKQLRVRNLRHKNLWINVPLAVAVAVVAAGMGSYLVLKPSRSRAAPLTVMVTRGTVQSTVTAYLQTSSGGIITVTTSPATTVTVSTPGTLGHLRAGQSITVQGSHTANGAIAATSIQESR